MPRNAAPSSANRVPAAAATSSSVPRAPRGSSGAAALRGQRARPRGGARPRQGARHQPRRARPRRAPARHLPHDRAGLRGRVRLQLLRQAPEARAARQAPERSQHLLRVRVRVLPAAARLLRAARALGRKPRTVQPALRGAPGRRDEEGVTSRTTHSCAVCGPPALTPVPAGALTFP